MCNPVDDSESCLLPQRVQFFLCVCPDLRCSPVPSDVIRSIRDPEKPNTLEELDVVTEQCVEVQELGDDEYLIIIRFSPTVPHCSLATLIGETHTHTRTDSVIPQTTKRLGNSSALPLPIPTSPNL